MAASMDKPQRYGQGDSVSSEEELDIDSHGHDLAGIDDNDCEDEMFLCSPSKCFFCDAFFDSGEKTLEHAEQEHCIPLSDIFIQPTFTFYDYIKAVNFFRKQQPKVECCQNLEDLKRQISSLDDSFMIPTDQEDGLLQLDFEGYQESLRKTYDNSNQVKQVIISTQEYQMLTSQQQETLRLRKTLEDLTEQYNTDLSKLRLSAQGFLSNQKLSAPDDVSTGSNGDDQRLGSKVHQLNDREDDCYISSYSHYSIHMEMLQDVIRTDGYRRAILQNSDMFKDKIVLDVGCGTGILSMFAAQAGARKVIGVDMSDVIYHAMDIIRENGLQDKITLIKGRIEEITLPCDKVDIIISEWMGYFLLFESMLDSVIFARQKWLNSSGVVWPNVCNILLTASSDAKLFNKNIGFWDSVYGFKMSCMKQEVAKEALVQVVNPNAIVASPVVVKSVDCCTTDVASLDFTAPFDLTVDIDCTVYAIVGYFDTIFDKAPLSASKVEFSTGPKETTTHWKQTVFLLQKPLQVKQGEKMSGTIDVRKMPKDPRSLQVMLKLSSITYKYHLS